MKIQKAIVAIAFCLGLCVASAALGQDRTEPPQPNTNPAPVPKLALSIDHQLVDVVENAKTRPPFNGLLLIDSDSPKLKRVPAALVAVKCEAANVSIEVTDSDRRPVPFDQVGNTLLIRKPGRCWVEVIALDSARNFFQRKTEAIDVPKPGDDPDDDEPDDDQDEDDDEPGPNVPNEYGVGLIAFKYAPRDPVTITKYSSIYRQCGDFIYGRPVAKSIWSDDPRVANDPNRNVFAWLKQQTGMIQCTDVETCKQWATWRTKISEAFREAQKRKQFTTRDWYNAFGEVAKALEMVR